MPPKVSWEERVAKLRRELAMLSGELPRDPRAMAAAVVRRRRMALGLRQQDVAERAGITQTMVARLESGDLNFTIETLEKVARALGCDVEIRLEPKP